VFLVPVSLYRRPHWLLGNRTMSLSPGEQLPIPRSSHNTHSTAGFDKMAEAGQLYSCSASMHNTGSTQLCLFDQSLLHRAMLICNSHLIFRRPRASRCRKQDLREEGHRTGSSVLQDPSRWPESRNFVDWLP